MQVTYVYKEKFKSFFEFYLRLLNIGKQFILIFTGALSFVIELNLYKTFYISSFFIILSPMILISKFFASKRLWDLSIIFNEDYFSINDKIYSYSNIEKAIYVENDNELNLLIGSFNEYLLIDLKESEFNFLKIKLEDCLHIKQNRMDPIA